MRERVYLIFLSSALAYLYLKAPALIGIFMLFMSVVPQLILLSRKEYTTSAVSWLFVFVILYIHHSMLGLFFLTLCLVYSFAYLYFLRKKTEPAVVIINTSIIWSILVTVSVLVLYAFFNTNPVQLVLEPLKQWSAILMGYYHDLNFPVEKLEILSLSFSAIINIMSSTLIALLLIFGAVTSFFIYYMLYRNSVVSSMPQMSRFRLPENSVWFLISAILLFIVTKNSFESNYFKLLATNIGLFLMAAYALSGLTLFIYFFKRWQVAAFIKNIAFILMLVYALFFGGYLFLVIVGVSDVWLDYRNRYENRRLSSQ